MNMNKQEVLSLLTYSLDKRELDEHITALARASLEPNPYTSRKRIREVFESWIDSAIRAEQESEAWEAMDYE